MTGPPERRPERRTRGRRSTDGLLERDIAELRRSFARLERTVGPVAGQVADVDGALQAVQASLRSLERWLEDERASRRSHDAELDGAIDRVGDRVGEVDRSLRDLIASKFAECMGALNGLGADSRAGRRTILITLVTTAGVVLAAYLQSR
jgi:chromosome segregation ATPase